ncbi:hypothetical protein ACFV03_51175 [Streptomyces mirabilis]|uniref:hypothetical protein n=1 Tax=Streptomyces mirabilis TaxID=68239 RepID=UPI00369A7A2D
MTVTPIRPSHEQSVEPDRQPPQAEPFFELRFAELRITVQWPPYRLIGALATGASALSVWLTR